MKLKGFTNLKMIKRRNQTTVKFKQVVFKISTGECFRFGIKSVPQTASAWLKRSKARDSTQFFEGVPSYFEALWYRHLYFYGKSNT